MPRFFVGNLLFFFFAVSLGWMPAALPSESRPNIQVEVIARGLETPWAIAFAPGGRVFVTERPGRIRVVNDGKLYWTVGDAQNTSFSQNTSSLNGKILRLNPDGTVPSDNPFAQSPVYSYGHRNPQGLAWQPGSGRLYATEHGPSGFQGCCLDEVNLIEAGKNYGW